jgi:formate hydrogenlyase transcriptional activator
MAGVTLSPDEQDALNRRIVEAASDAILCFDRDGTIVYLNPAAERVLRVRAADAIGTSASRFGTAEGLSARTAALDELGRETEARIFFSESEGMMARRADGTLFLHEGSLSRVDVGARAFFAVIFRDVEQRRADGRALVHLERQNAWLREELNELAPSSEIIGRSPALRALLDQISLVATTDTTVLVLGETGTGKDLVARAVHARSRRRARPLVKVNCAALPAGLVESEIFGHERGAFTGATDRRLGRFEVADGGTIFLDEVGELPLETQAKLLRVLQEREFERVGGTKTMRIDVRVIAATNRDLKEATAAGRFRQDLYFRLSVFPLTVPALRERDDDVTLLAEYFVARHGAQLGRRYGSLAPATVERLRRYAWPGNVRELQNVVERAVILSPGPTLQIAPGLLEVTPAVPDTPQAPPGALEHVQREHIVKTLRETGWRIDGPTGAARRLGVPSSTLRSRMQKLGIRRSDASE